MDYTDFVDNCQWLQKRCELLAQFKSDSDDDPVNQASGIVSGLFAIRKEHIQAAVLGIHEDFVQATNLLDAFSIKHLGLLDYKSFSAFMTSLVSRSRILSGRDLKYKNDFELIAFIDELIFSSKIVFDVVIRVAVTSSALKDKIKELYDKIIYAESVIFPQKV
jgi:hypothetical protein